MVDGGSRQAGPVAPHLRGRRLAVVAAVLSALVVLGVTLLLVLPGGGGTEAAAPCHPIGGPVRVGESIRATYLPTHLVLGPGSESDPRSAPVVYGLPPSAFHTEAGPTVTLEVLPAAVLGSFVPPGLVSRPVMVQSHQGLLATTPTVVPRALSHEIGRIHIYWQPSADIVVSFTTSEIGESLADTIAAGIQYSRAT